MVRATILLFLLLLSSAPQVTLANVEIWDPVSGQRLEFPTAYAPKLGSIEDFDPLASRPVVQLGDLCFDRPVDVSLLVNSPVAFFSALDCDETVALYKLAPHASEVAAVVQLYGSSRAIADLGAPDTNPNDEPPRFAHRPPTPPVLVFLRVHGSDSGEAAQMLAEYSSGQLRGSVGYTPDPWQIAYRQPVFVGYYVVVMLFFVGYVPQHAIRSLVGIRRRRGQQLAASSRGVDLQLVTMSLALALGVFRGMEYGSSISRDYFGLWVPEILAQLMWGYSYVILLFTMLLFVLFWSDVMRSSKLHVAFLETFSLKLFFGCLFVVVVVLTTLIVLFVYQIPGTGPAKDAGFILLGLLTLLESIGVMVIGGRLLKQLTDVKPIGERQQGGSTLQLKVVDEDPNMVQSDNPQYGRASPSKSRASFKHVSSFSTSTKLQPGASEDERKQAREARRRAKPLTRLVVVSATLLLCATILSLASTFSQVLLDPHTYVVPFALLAVIEITIYALVLHVMSPIWQERRRRSTTQQQQQTTSGGVGTDGKLVVLKEGENPSNVGCWAKLRTCCGAREEEE